MSSFTTEDTCVAAGHDCSSRESPPPVTLRLTEAGWLPEAADLYPASEAEGVPTRFAWASADGAVGGVGRLRSSVAADEAARLASDAALIGAAFVPVMPGSALFFFRLSFDLFVGDADDNCKATCGLCGAPPPPTPAMADAAASLYSPWFAVEPRYSLSFMYHMFGTNTAQLSVQAQHSSA